MIELPKGYRALMRSERLVRAGAVRVGPTNADELISVSVRIRRRPDAPRLPEPGNIAATPVGERCVISRKDFAAHFGAAESDIDAIASFAVANGLTLVESSVARRTVVLSGPAECLCRAFAVELGRYESASEAYRGREGSIHLPVELARIVEGVFGLDNRRMARPVIQLSRQPASAEPLTPPQVAQLYGFPASVNAAGQTIGLLEFGGGYRLSDIQSWFAGLQLPTPSLASVRVDGADNATGGSDDAEVALDIDVAGSVAPGAALAVYFAPNTEQGWVDAVTTAIHDGTNAPSVLSISWGWAEMEANGLSWSRQAVDAIHGTFKEAAALGVTVIAAAGDHGSDAAVGDGRARVLYPASDPLVTACGGTRISNVSGRSFSEETWNARDGIWLTGGGISDLFSSVPGWQAAVQVPGSANDGHRGRGIPDIAGNADGASGYRLSIDGREVGPVGGTSATAPLYAGLVALMNADLGKSVGYLNPSLYAFRGPYVFRDVADAVSNARGGAPGYRSGAGWDACAGLGVVNGSALLAALRGTGLPPALTVHGGALHGAWKGTGRDDRVFGSRFEGGAWSPPRQIPGVYSSSGPVLAAFSGKRLMAWKGMQGDEGIYLSVAEGDGWMPPMGVAGALTSTGPRLAALGDRLYLAWKGREGDQRIFWTSYDGASWSPQQFVPNVATSVTPALGGLRGELILAWKGWYGDPALYWSRFDGSSFGPRQPIPGAQSSEGPSLAAVGDRLFATWKGPLGDSSLWFSSFDGTGWAAPQPIPGAATQTGAGLAAVDHVLVAAWKGVLGDPSIWWSRLDSNAWLGRERLSGPDASALVAESANQG